MWIQLQPDFSYQLSVISLIMVQRKTVKQAIRGKYRLQCQSAAIEEVASVHLSRVSTWYASTDEQYICWLHESTKAPGL